MSYQNLRKEKNDFFKHDPHSPLDNEQRRAFSELNYYPEDRSLRFDASVQAFANPQVIKMQTSTGELRDYIRYGRIQFEVKGQPFELTVYSSGNGDAFVPFADTTSGRETYGAGRYLDLEWKGGDQLVVDFNLAYNPWCAYSPNYSCPLPPLENRLQVPIRAGEKDFSG